ncbi:hypothetical protein K1719_031064 [Acacia pycnantha]|nr:hypothetical protein K1719_031064 [Acacia pycnantha]
MGSVIYWNCRGVRNRGFFQQIKPLIRNSDPSVLVLSETKSEVEGPFRCLERLGFVDRVVVPSVGRSGGLIAAWRKDRVSVSVLSKNRQIINLRCLFRGAPPVILLAVYSVPMLSLKQI